MSSQSGLFDSEVPKESQVEQADRAVASLILRLTLEEVQQLARGDMPDGVRQAIHAEAGETLKWFDGSHPWLRAD